MTFMECLNILHVVLTISSSVVTIFNTRFHIKNCLFLPHTVATFLDIYLTVHHELIIY